MGDKYEKYHNPDFCSGENVNSREQIEQDDAIEDNQPYCTNLIAHPESSSFNSCMIPSHMLQHLVGKEEENAPSYHLHSSFSESRRNQCKQAKGDDLGQQNSDLPEATEKIVIRCMCRKGNEQLAGHFPHCVALSHHNIPSEEHKDLFLKSRERNGRSAEFFLNDDLPSNHSSIQSGVLQNKGVLDNISISSSFEPSYSDLNVNHSTGPPFSRSPIASGSENEQILHCSSSGTDNGGYIRVLYVSHPTRMNCDATHFPVVENAEKDYCCCSNISGMGKDNFMITCQTCGFPSTRFTGIQGNVNVGNEETKRKLLYNDDQDEC